MTATAPFRVGGWLPSDQAFLDQWVGDLVAKVEAEDGGPLLPVVDEFRRLIEEDPALYMLFRFMLKQVPHHKSPTHQPQVKTDFVCDPARPHYGFTSWDDFFTRRFRAGVRPVASPADPDVIANACESAPYRVSRNVKR